MILLTKNEEVNIPFYLTKVSTHPYIAFRVVNKTTKDPVEFLFQEESGSEPFMQIFNFEDVVELREGTYDYFIYGTMLPTNPDSTSLLLETGLLKILGIGNCVTPDILFNDENNGVVFYDCDNQ